MASEQHRALDHFFVAEWVFSCAYIQATNMTIALKHPIISAAISIRLHKNGLWKLITIMYLFVHLQVQKKNQS